MPVAPFIHMAIAIAFLTMGGASVAQTAVSAADLLKAETLAGGTLYNDQVARQVGDLITIQVKETTSVSEKQKTETTRNNDAGFEVKALPNTSRVPANPSNPELNELPKLSLTSAKAFKGEGKHEASGEVKAVITARVTDILDNGNLVIVGTRSVQANSETKTIKISGVIRASDIKPDNTVASEKLANLEVSIDGEGQLSRAQQQGWLGRALDVVWPF